MLRLLFAALIALCPHACAGTESFDSATPGSLPAGWAAGVTGRGAPHWAVTADPTAPSKLNVLKQSGSGDYPWCVMPKTRLADGFVQTKFKALSGAEDQAGGLIWRWQDGDNYYVARANALENNVSLYYTKGGRRTSIAYQSAPLALNVWHTLRVAFSKDEFKVFLDGRLVISKRDGHLTEAGSVGVWTKADSTTAFDDFSFGDLTAK
jgi:hypothetical protein